MAVGFVSSGMDETGRTGEGAFEHLSIIIIAEIKMTEIIDMP